LDRSRKEADFAVLAIHKNTLVMTSKRPEEIPRVQVLGGKKNKPRLDAGLF
jgi:hypothetical protein